MASIVLSSMDPLDQDRFAEQLIDLNLALGNKSEAAIAAVESALGDQKQGNYKVLSPFCVSPSHVPALCLQLHLGVDLLSHAACLASKDNAHVVQSAHAKLLRAAERVRAAEMALPPILLSALSSLHSYMLVKQRVQLDDHLGAARLLCRVYGNISRFERHAARILTSAVLECLRAGLPETALEIASSLLRAEYQEALSEMGGNYRRKIEGVVWHPTAYQY
jgi:hypothetical protein